MGVAVAIDGMGGDRAPAEIVAGAVRSVHELGVRVLLVGVEAVLGPLVESAAAGADVSEIELVDAGEVIGMDVPATSVRTKKDASVVRTAELVRDGRADAMVSAGNTGAAMSAAVLRLGRIRGVARPAIAVPIPVPGSYPQILVDAGATVDSAAEWLFQFALMGREYARIRLGVDQPTVGLLSIGEEAGKGDDLRKAAHPLLARVPGFVGNVEGRDVMRPGVAVVLVTDGFTGNIVLKTVEGTIRGTSNLVFQVLGGEDAEMRAAAAVVAPRLRAAATILDPDHTGGAVLVGVDGVCVISHGSSNALAVLSAVRCAVDCDEGRVVERMREAIQDAR